MKTNIKVGLALFLVLLAVGAIPLVTGWSIDSIVETGKVPDQPTSGVIPGGEYVAEGIAKNPTSVSIVLISPDKKISLYLADVTNGVYMKKIPIKADATLGNYYVVVLDSGADGELSIDLQKYMGGDYTMEELRKMVKADADMLLETGSDDSYSLDIFEVTDDIGVSGDITKEKTINRSAAEAKDEGGNILELTGDKLEINMLGGDLIISLPVKLAQGDKLDSFNDPDSEVTFDGKEIKISIKNVGGKKIADIIATVDEAKGAGDYAQAKISKLKLKTSDVRADISGAKPDVGKVEATLEGDLADLPEGASISVKIKAKLDNAVVQAFQTKASEAGLSADDFAYGVDVDHTNLDATNAKVKLKVKLTWAQKHGTANVKIFRYSADGTPEILQTTYMGVEGDMAVFEGASPSGFSVFALGSAKAPTATPTAPPSSTPGFEICLALVGLLAAYVLLGKRE